MRHTGKRSRAILLAAAPAALAAVGAVAHAAPEAPIPVQSDLCARAIPLAPGAFTGTTAGAGREFVASCGGSPFGQGPDVWFTWTSPCPGSLTLDTAGSEFNTVLSILTACPGDPGVAQIACNNDDPALAPASRLTFEYEPNVTYYVRLGGVAGGQGSFSLGVAAATWADHDASGAVDSADIADFLNFWFQSVQAGTPADFSGDGATDSADISAFLATWIHAVQSGC